jgi:hypothetical protein
VADLLILEDLAVANLRSVADEGAKDFTAVTDGHVVHDDGVLDLHVRADLYVAADAAVVDRAGGVFDHYVLVDDRVDDSLLEKVSDFCLLSLCIIAFLFAIEGDQSLLKIVLGVPRDDWFIYFLFLGLSLRSGFSFFLAVACSILKRKGNVSYSRFSFKLLTEFAPDERLSMVGVKLQVHF